MDVFPLVLPTTAAQPPKVDALIKELKGTQLPLTEPYAGHTKGPRQTNPTTRPEPEGFHDPSFESAYLVHPLQVGVGWTSQVWLASFHPGTAADKANLVVKIYQSSLHSAMHAGTNRQYVDEDDAWHMFHEYVHEAEAYQAYAALQGSYVPHVRGFYLVTLRNGERAVAMVMERIRKVEPSPSTIELEHAFDGLFEAAHALYKCGPFSSDFRPRNVLWPATADGRHCTSPPVFIDFGRMHFQPGRVEVQLILAGCIRMMRQYAFPLDRVMSRAKSAITPTSPIAEQFSLTAKDVSAILQIGASRHYDPEDDRSRSPQYDVGGGDDSE